MPKYGIATLLEDCPVGFEFRSNVIPLHITHVDSFVIDLGADDLAAKLQKQLRGFPGFEVRALGNEMLGPNKDIPVTMLALNDQLRRLHISIMSLLADEGAVLKNPHFHNDGFLPHVSIYESRRIMPGELVAIKDVSIAAKLSEDPDAIHRILATVALE